MERGARGRGRGLECDLTGQLREGSANDRQKVYGENAVENSGGGGWGTRRELERVMARFVDNEADWSWPANGHLMQVVSGMRTVCSRNSHQRSSYARKDAHTNMSVDVHTALRNVRVSWHHTDIRYAGRPSMSCI